MRIGPTLRAAAHRVRTSYRQVRYPELPILFANSFPKSGTHLLLQMLAGFGRLGPFIRHGDLTSFEHETGRRLSADEIGRAFRRIPPGAIARGHLHADAAATAVLRRRPVVHYFIYRDPRDVVVSHAHYVTFMKPNHVHHHHYAHELSTMEDRITTSIRGRPELDVDFSDIRSRFEPYRGWLAHPDVLPIRFEDAVGESRQVMSQVIDHAHTHGLRLEAPREALLEAMEESVDPQRSPTFRTGQSGSWREQFTPEHKALFKELSGDLLMELGYERSNDW